MHVKDHTIPLPIPLPIRGEPDLYRIRFGGVGYVGTRDECAAIGTALEAAASRLAGDAAVDAAREVDYRDTWAPLLSRKSLPGYIASVVPEWASEMHWAAVNNAAA